MDELIKARDAARAQAKALHEKAEGENRAFTEEEQESFDAFISEAENYEKRIEAARKLNASDSWDSSPAGRKTQPVDPAKTQSKITDVHDRRADDPWRMHPTCEPFTGAADFARSVRSACQGVSRDPRLFAAPTTYQNESVGIDGGYAVPAAMRSEIWQHVFAQTDFLQLANPEPTESNTVEVVKDETTPWGSSGVQAYWLSEAAQITASKTAHSHSSVKLETLACMVQATDELLEDSPRLEQRLTLKAADAISWKGSDAIYGGDGVGKPLGFMNAACLVTQAKESGQTAATITAANIAKMFGRLIRQPGGRAAWFVNPDALNQLITMTLGQQPIWTPPTTGLKDAPGGFLMGLPVIPNEHCATLGTVGDIVLADMAGYYCATKQGGVKAASSIHLFFDYSVTAFRWTIRLAGQPFLSAALTPANGSNTRSHFVALATRA